jgi:hypothetical protein
MDKYMQAVAGKNHKKGFWAKLLGVGSDESKTNNKLPPVNAAAAAIISPQNYLAHDNGGRPFLTIFTKETFAVYKPSNVDEMNKNLKYDKCILKPTKYVQMFIGKDPHNKGKRYDGNSLLIQTGKKDFVFVGWKVYKMKIDDDIVGYKSPIIGSDVHYPYAVGAKNTYLFLEETYIPNEMIVGHKDPYLVLYDMPQKQQQEFMKTHKMNVTKLIHERLWQ